MRHGNLLGDVGRDSKLEGPQRLVDVVNSDVEVCGVALVEGNAHRTVEEVARAVGCYKVTQKILQVVVVPHKAVGVLSRRGVGVVVVVDIVDVALLGVVVLVA